jgi:hypothetical protein
MKAVLEINAATLRVFSEGAVFGDPFEFALVIVGDEKTAIIKGLRLEGDQQLTARHRSAIMRCLMEAGFTRAIWHRWRRGPNGPEQRTFVIDTEAATRGAGSPEISGNHASASTVIPTQPQKRISVAWG